MKLPHWVTAGLLIGLFVIAFALRAYQPVSRPEQWLYRSNAFNAALDARDWAATYQSRHPGYTTMVISGLTLRLYDVLAGTPAEELFDWAIPSYATDYGREMTVGVVGLAFVLAGLIVIITVVLRRLAGWPLALTAAGLVTFAPFYLAQSRVLHVDALVSTLMILSALLVLLHVQTGQRRYLLLSGLVGGIAFLTKVPALFLVPFTGLTLLVHLVLKIRAAWPDHGERRGRWLVGETWRGLARPGLLWLLVAALTLTLWPAMWVQPLTTLGNIFAGAGEHIGNPHPNPRFFAGRIYNDTPPSVLFYPTLLAFNSTFATLTLSLTAFGHYTLWRRRVNPPLRPITFWLLAAYVLFYMLQMMIGAKQVERYLLPAHLALDLLAAVGLVGLADMLKQAVQMKHARLASTLPPLLIGLTVGLQALVTLPFAPDYGVHRNYLLGGNQTAVRMIDITGQNEGITYIAEYLNQQSNPWLVKVGITHVLRQSMLAIFPGKIFDQMASDQDYYLFSRDAMQRYFLPDQWEAAWESVQDRPPQMVVSYDGVDYLWLYTAQPPPEPIQTIVIRRGGGVGFIVLAWAWVALLVALLVWAIRRRLT